MWKKAIISLALLAAFPPRNVAARAPGDPFHPPVLSRSAWGADESLGITATQPPDSGAAADRAEKTADDLRSAEPRSLSEREKRCNDAARANPEDFRIRRTETHNREGGGYVWPRRYSPQVKLLVIHHTGETESPEREALSGIERVRAIYRGHTVNNGWGDIGYHYLIDKEGIIYEGRAGGPNVVGGHVYCANVGTIGVALIGNFLQSYPFEAQLRSLRWLLADLSETYRIRPNGRTVFQGTTMPTIVTHRDLGPSQDPGRRTYGLMPVIRRLVARRDFTTALIPNVGAPRWGAQPPTELQLRRPGRATYAKKIPRRIQRRMEQYRKTSIDIK